MSLADIFEINLSRDEEMLPRPLHEAQISTLKEALARYSACRFSVGDIVTPHKAAPLAEWLKGEPHIVLEVRQDPACDWEAGNVGTPAYGSKVDMRVAFLSSDHDVLTLWVESHDFELSGSLTN